VATVEPTKEFTEDPIGFLTAQKKLHPHVFNLKRSAKNQYFVVNDPMMIEQVLDDKTGASFGSPAALPVNRNVFGVSGDILDKHEARVVQVLRGFLIKNKEGLVTRIATQMKSFLGERLGESGTMDLRDLGEAIFWPMTQALFGDHAVEKVQPGLYKAWETIDGQFGAAVKGHSIPELKAAVKMAATNFEEAINGKSACPMGPALEFYNSQVGTPNGGSAEAAAGMATAAWWGGLGNTWPSTVWTFGEILRDPELRRRAYEEVDKNFADQPDADGNFDVDRLPFFTSCLMEMLRMRTYSIAWRMAQKDALLVSEDGTKYPIKAGTLIGVFWAVQHFDEEMWTKPFEFRPDRHLPGKEELKAKNLSAVRERFALSPFSWGPHKCSGYPLAMVEIPVALAITFQLYDMELLDSLPGPDWKAAFGVVGPDSQPTRVKYTLRRK
jgi:cytochrome P450